MQVDQVILLLQVQLKVIMVVLVAEIMVAVAAVEPELLVQTVLVVVVEPVEQE
tara:strand:- start:273 stop:431 length:159 start_codon:yes stop_codon:yes gene_type:complete